MGEAVTGSRRKLRRHTQREISREIRKNQNRDRDRRRPHLVGSQTYLYRSSLLGKNASWFGDFRDRSL